ncbi:MAG: hypothetical protein J1F35_02555 [Erysipelotrichales bacterium]|nr:hypothetical protein [Erysipelotrichales bacterium]
MEKTKMNVNAQTLLFEYMCLKVKNDLGTTVDATEFEEFSNQLIEYVNNNHKKYDFSLDINDFDEICNKVISDNKTNENDNWLTYHDGVLKATYDLKSRQVLDNMSAKKFLYSYFEEEVASKEWKPDYFNSKYHYPNIEERYDNTVKNIAAYLVHYLMKQYIELMVSKHMWPSQCWCPNYNILDQDLACRINLPGTRGEFTTIYIWAQMVICEMLKNRDHFEISNNPENCLAFANFSEIVAPFKSMDLSIYNEIDFAKRHKTISIIVNNGDVILRECEYDPNEARFEYSDYKLPESEPEFFEQVVNSGKVGLHLAGTHKHFVA